MPPDDERRDGGLIPARRSTEKIYDRGLLLHGLAEPAVIRRVQVGSP
jgi:hypothetical protein